MIASATALALALQKRVGRHRRAHAHLGDVAAFLRQHPADRLQRRILILAGIFRQQLFDAHPPVGRAGDHIGEGAAAIDRKGPARLHAARL